MILPNHLDMSYGVMEEIRGEYLMDFKETTIGDLLKANKNNLIKSLATI